jgi:hypothetical protein
MAYDNYVSENPFDADEERPLDEQAALFSESIEAQLRDSIDREAAIEVAALAEFIARELQQGANPSRLQRDCVHEWGKAAKVWLASRDTFEVALAKARIRKTVEAA